MKIVPKRNQILGTQVEITIAASGIILPDQERMKASIFILIEAVGEGVKDYKVGDVVMPYKSNNIFLRGGYHKLIMAEEDILAVVEDLPLDRLSVGGKPLRPAEDGKFALPG